MTQPTYPPNYPGAPLPPGKTKRFGLVAVALIGGGGLLVGSVLGVLGASAGTTAAPVTATATATKLVTVYAHPSETSEPTETAPAGFHPRKSDFVVTLKILKKECFGSAGCNISYRIKPLWAGSQDIPETGTTEVTYRVTGGDSGAVDNTFTVEGQTVNYDQEESISTHPHPHLKVKVVDVSYDG